MISPEKNPSQMHALFLSPEGIDVDAVRTVRQGNGAIE